MRNSHHGSSMCSIERRVGQRGRAVDLHEHAVGLEHAVLHRGRREDDVHVVLALEPLLDDLHVKETEKAEAVAKAQRLARLRLVGERGVVELQLLQRIAQFVVVVRVAGVEAGKDHRLERLIAGQLFGGGPRGERNRVAHVQVLQGLEAGGDIADLAGVQLADGQHGGYEHADLQRLHQLAGVHGQQARRARDRAVDHAHVGDHAFVRCRSGSQRPAPAPVRRGCPAAAAPLR